jgi:hypothetical protein
VLLDRIVKPRDSPVVYVAGTWTVVQYVIVVHGAVAEDDAAGTAVAATETVDDAGGA